MCTSVSLILTGLFSTHKIQRRLVLVAVLEWAMASLLLGEWVLELLSAA